MYVVKKVGGTFEFLNVNAGVSCDSKQNAS